MSKPTANLAHSLSKKASTPARAGGVASTFRDSSIKGPTKKATYELPIELHKALHLHAVTNDVSMRDLVVKYLEAGLRNDGVKD